MKGSPKSLKSQIRVERIEEALAAAAARTQPKSQRSTCRLQPHEPSQRIGEALAAAQTQPISLRKSQLAVKSQAVDELHEFQFHCGWVRVQDEVLISQ